jgi:hypothetical protein
MMGKVRNNIDGINLVLDYQNTQVMLTTIDGAEHQAKQTENNILSQFSSYKQAEVGIVRSTDLPLSDDSRLVHDSINAHLQKVQSEQIKQQGISRIRDLGHNANVNYLSKKIKVNVLGKVNRPFHSIWTNKLSGAQSFSKNVAPALSGVISEIDLVNNYLVIKPTAFRRLVNSQTTGYYVEIISLDSLQPMVDIQFI